MCDPPTKEGTHGAYVVYPWLITSHVPGYGVRAFPMPRRSGGQVLVPVAPRLTQYPPERETAAEHRRLGLITRSSPYRQPHPTFREGHQGERAVWPLVPGMATHRPYPCRGEYAAKSGRGEKGTYDVGRALPGSPPLCMAISGGG